ncbi:MAG: hypothetical protein QOE99_3215, partial [Actinomycetota bacterium]|nr:hypothetical protein [Actinomycetota bacterium]
MRRTSALLAVTALLAIGMPTVALAKQDKAPERTIRAGVGVSDATWNVGASAGQYADPHASLANSVDGDV